MAQKEHLARLRAMERYPGVTFNSADHLAWNLLRSYVLDGLVEANLDLQRPPPTASCWTWPGAWDFSGYLREKRRGCPRWGSWERWGTWGGVQEWKAWRPGSQLRGTVTWISALTDAVWLIQTYC
jgi:hypothetical protein